MSVVAVAVGGAALVGAYAAGEAADAQADAAIAAGDTQLLASRENIEFQERALDRILEENKATLDRQEELNAPWQEAGLVALDQVRRKTREGGKRYNPETFKYDGKTYEPREFDFQADPGYQFRKNQIEKAVERRASGRGRNASPATDKELAEYVGGLASQEYGNAFNRYATMRNFDDKQRAFDNVDRDFERGKYIEDRDFEESGDRFEVAQLFDIANLGRGASASNVSNAGQAGGRATSAISGATNNISAQNTYGANALSQAYLNRGAAKAQGYGGMATALNMGTENMLLAKYAGIL